MFKKKHCMTCMYMRNRYKVIDNHMSMGLNVDCYHKGRHSSTLFGMDLCYIFINWDLRFFNCFRATQNLYLSKVTLYFIDVNHLIVSNGWSYKDCSVFFLSYYLPFLSPEFLRYDWIDFPENFRGHRE